MELHEYLKAYASYPSTITDGERVKLFAIIRGTEASKDDLQNAYVRVIASCIMDVLIIAKKFYLSGLPLVELLHEGVLALQDMIATSQAYNPERANVMAYGNRTVFNAIRDYVAANRPDHEPCRMTEWQSRQLRKVRQMKKDFEEPPTAEDVLNKLKARTDKPCKAMGIEQVERYLGTISAKNIALQAPVNDDSSLTNAGCVANEDPDAEELLSEKRLWEKYERLLAKILTAFDNLADEFGTQDTQICRLLLGFEGDLSFREIGERFGIKKQNVDLIKKRVMPRFLELTGLDKDQLKQVTDLIKLENMSCAA
ncbi:MAG: hypothetical protein PHC70_00555 [Patescibacteria group bacterium]|nr:hypothetical protein [Patescibacteria group bacterium]